MSNRRNILDDLEIRATLARTRPTGPFRTEPLEDIIEEPLQWEWCPWILSRALTWLHYPPGDLAVALEAISFFVQHLDGGSAHEIFELKLPLSTRVRDYIRRLVADEGVKLLVVTNIQVRGGWHKVGLRLQELANFAETAGIAILALREMR